MSAKTYLWIEDRKGKANFIFWKIFMHEICPDVIVESKMNNRELVKAVKGLSDQENRYIIAFDNSFDNVQIYMEQKILKQAADIRANVFLLDLVCFEYTLLEFDKLIEWIYAPEDEFIEKRAGAIAAREKLVQMIKSGELNYKEIQEVMDYDNNLEDHNIEQLSAKLLFDLTRNKSTLVLNIAAKLSKGEGLDDKMKPTEPINVIYQTAEDGLADTVKPRLELAGADCSRISIIDESEKSISMEMNC